MGKDDKRRGYWFHQLSGAPPQDYPRTNPSRTGSRSRGVQEVRLQHEMLGATALNLKTVMHATLAIVLGQHAGSEDVIFGSFYDSIPSANHKPREATNQILSVIPFRVRLEDSATISSFLQSVESTLTDGLFYGPVAPGDFGHINPDIDAAFRVQTFLAVCETSQHDAFSNYTHLKNIHESHHGDHPLDQYRISIVAEPRDDSWVVTALYDESCLAAGEMHTFLDHFFHVLAKISSKALQNHTLGEIELHSPLDEDKIRAANNYTPQPVRMPVHRVISKQVQARRDSTAVYSKTSSLTYGQMDTLATKLAHHLSYLGVKRGQFVALYLEKTILAPVAVLAVLKAGGAFLFLEPSFPFGRLQEIVSLAKPAAIISSARYSAKSAQLSETTFVLDHGFLEQLPLPNDLLEESHPDDIAYITFTSGSTGKPKGVVHTHQVLSTYAVLVPDNMILNEGTRLLHHVSYSFIVVICDFLGIFAAGGCLCVVDADYVAGDLTRMINELEANTCMITPSTLRTMSPDGVPGLRVLHSGGEVMGRDVAELWASRLHLLNTYGATETAGCSVAHHVKPGEEFPTSLANAFSVNQWLVDANNPDRLAPVGAVGEILFSGPALARGYLNDEQRTSETFVKDPIWAKRFGRGGQIFYKTGDLGRYNPDMTIQWVGRKTATVKLRGQRLDLNEIEFHLKNDEDVNHAIALLPDSGLYRHRLVALCSLKAFDLKLSGAAANPLPSVISLEEAVDAAELIRVIACNLGKSLPPYMIPEDFIIVDTIPLLPSRKLNRVLVSHWVANIDKHSFVKARALMRGNPMQSPATKTQALLQQIWSEVLGIPANEVDLGCSFMALGGDSLLAIKLVTLARKSGLRISLSEILQRSSIEELAATADSIASPFSAGVRSADMVENDMIPTTLHDLPSTFKEIEGIEDVYGLSPMQHGLALSQMKSSDSTYTVSIFIKVRANGRSLAQVDRLSSAWQEVTNRHPILRTTFVEGTVGDGIYQQVVLRHVSAAISIVSLTDESQVWEAWKSKSAQTLRLSVESPHRVTLYHTTNGQIYALMELNHIIFDAESGLLMLRDWEDAYNGDLPSTPAPAYRAYVEEVTKGESFAATGFWKHELEGLEPTIFPTLLESGKTTPRRVLTSYSSFTNLDKLRSITKELDLTIADVVKAAWALVLRRYLQRDDVCFGYLASGRDLAVDGVEGIVGPLINLITCRAEVGAAKSVRQVLENIHDGFVRALPHQMLPLAHVIELTGQSPGLFNTIVSLQPISNPGVFHQEGLKLEVMDSFNATEFDIAVIVDQLPDRLDIRLNYSDSIGSPTSMAYVSESFSEMLNTITSTFDLSIKTIPTLGTLDRDTIEQWNALKPLSVHQCVHHLIQQQAAKNSDACAISAHDGLVTYGSLDQMSSKLAHYLVKAGIGRDSFVPLCFEKSKWFTIALLAVLKAGGAFLPLHTESPIARLRYICRQAKARIVLTSHEQAAKVEGLTERIITVNDALLESLASEAHHQETCVSPSDPAYVIYTSGSTGLPKGAVISHRAYSSAAFAHRQALHIDDGSRVLSFADYSFDTSMEDHLTTLIVGGTLCVPAEDERRNDLPGFMRRLKVNWAHITPSMASVLEGEELPDMKVLALGGETMTARHIEYWSPRVRLINLYGPSEASVTSTINDGHLNSANASNIGKAVGCLTWVVNREDSNQLLPVGCLGELLIEGPIVADGYLEDPERSSQAFISPPAWRSWYLKAGAPSSKFYASGDLVRYNSDGTLSFVGRKDTQIKLRGQRIELQEIEHAILKHKIKFAACLVPDSGPCKDRLVAIFSSEANPVMDQLSVQSHFNGLAMSAFLASLQEFLALKLPLFMMPDVFIAVAHLPVLLSRKLDRRRINEFVAKMSADEFESLLALSEGPHMHSHMTEVERHLVGIWSEVLNVPAQRIGPNTSFMMIGGDSISAIRVMSKARSAGIKISVQDILRRRTICEIGKIASRSDFLEAEDNLDLVADDENVPFELSPIQELHFQFSPEGNNGNQQSFLFEVREAVTQDDLIKGLAAVVKAHGMLRARFSRSNTWKQSISRDLKGHVRVHHRILNSKAEIGTLIRETKEAINFQTGPLCAAELINVTANQYLFITIHHLVIDLVSWRVILEDLESFLVKREPVLPEAISFQKWTIAQLERARRLPAAVLDEINLPTPDYGYWGMQGESNTYRDVLDMSFTLDKNTTSALLGICNRMYRTDPLDLFLAALLHSFNETFDDRPSPIIFNEGHGREPWSSSTDLSRTVGWFTTLYPIRMGDPNGLLDTVRRVKDSRHQIADNGRAFFANLFHAGGSLSPAKVFPVEIVFNYLGIYQQFESEQALFRAQPLPVEAKLRDGSERHSLFTVLAVVEETKLRFTLEYSRKIAKIDRVGLWIANLEACLCSLPRILTDQPVKATLSDFDLLSATYDDLERLHTDTVSVLGISDLNQVEDIYPVSPLQEGLILSQLKNDDLAYRQYFIFDVTPRSGIIEVQRLRRAWEAVVRRHSILRSVFIESVCDDHAFDQVVLKEVDSRISVVAASEKYDVVQLCKDNLSLTPLQFGLGPLHHLTIIKTEDGRVISCLEKNHLLSDGTSSALLFKDLISEYEAVESRVSPPSYRDYIQYLRSRNEAAEIEYWQTRLDGIQPSSLPSFNIGKEHASAVVHRISFPLVETAHIQRFCRAHDATSSNVLQLAWSLVLQAYTGVAKACFGYLSSGRNIPISNSEKILGPMANILLCTASLEPTSSVLESIRKLQEDSVESLSHQTTPLSRVFQAAGVSADLFNTIMSHQKVDGEKSFSGQHISIQLLDYRDETEYAISLAISEAPDTIMVEFDYHGSLLSEEQAWAVAETYQTAVSSILQDPSQTISHINLLSPRDRKQILEWNKEQPSETYQCLHDLLLSGSFRARRDSPAIYAWDGHLTYSELDALSSRLAHHLIRLGLEPEANVLLLFEKSMWMTVAMLAVMKAGGAFTPLDPAHPSQRIHEIANETEAHITICSETTRTLAESLTRTCVPLGFESIPTPPMDSLNLHSPVSPSNTLCVIFTSGSTGQPKGIVIEHQAFSSVVAQYCSRYRVNERSRVLQFASYAFDTFLQDTFATLYAGGCLCVPSEESRMSNLAGFAREANVTFLDSTPSFITTMTPEDIPTLEVLSLAGEPLTPANIAVWADRVHLVNSYGPSECCPTTHVTNGIQNGDNPRNVGHGIGALSWVVDPASVDKLVPIGAVGELVIESASLARGYLNQAGATTELFIYAPKWHPRYDTSLRLYKTGDLVRFDFDGSLVYIGRKDAQVKLRAQRIEPGEVEIAISRHSPITHSVVLLPATGRCQGKLVAVLSLTARCPEVKLRRIELSPSYDKEGVESYISDIRSNLRGVLPSYMVPNLWIVAKELPLLLSGKVDRKTLNQCLEDIDEETLRKVSAAVNGSDAVHEEPITRQELLLRDLWVNILRRVPKESLHIGRNDDFFHLGGDSLAAIQLIALARKDRISLGFRDIFEYPRLRDQAGRIRSADAQIDRPNIPAFALLGNKARVGQTRADAALQCGVLMESVQDIYPCTDLQSNLMGLSLRYPGAYVLRKVYNLPADLDFMRFKKAWVEVFDSSAILRTRIIQTIEDGVASGKMLQVVVDEQLTWPKDLTLTEYLATDSKIEMDFGTPLFRIALLKESNVSHFMITIHHALYDGWSWEMLWQKVLAFYQGRGDREEELGFNNFVGYYNELGVQECRNYWKGELEGIEDSTFPKSTSPSHQPATDNTVHHAIELPDKAISETVKSITGPSMIRAALAIAISRYVGNTNFTYGATLSGRDAELPGIHEINGPTFCTVPIRATFDMAQPVIDFLSKVQKQSLDMIPHQHFGLENISRVSSSARQACKFGCIIVIQPHGDAGPIAELGLEPSDYGTRTSLPHPLVIEFAQSISGVDMRLQHDSSIITAESVINFAHQFEHILRQLYATRRGQALRDLSFVRPFEKQQLLLWNGKNLEQHDRCIHQDIEEQVQQRPHALAVRSWDGNLTYSELNTIASRLALQLVALGVGPEIVVPICVQRSKWAVISRLAVWKAGGAFISLNATDPVARLQALVQRVSAKVVLTSQDFELACKALAENVVLVDSWNPSVPAGVENMRQNKQPKPSNCAVILFTSGSTGTPKGVVLEHGQLLSSMRAHGQFLGYSPETRIFHASGYTFDAHIEEIFCTLIHGGTVCIPTEDEKMTNPTKAIQELAANFINVTPTFARLIKPELTPSAKTMVFIGEKLSTEDLKGWPAHVRLINGFGPTECSIFSNLMDIQDREGFTGSIGFPVGCRTWVVDSHDYNILCPIGAIGELLIEGPIVTRGYHNDDSRTQRSFITNPKWAKDFDFGDDSPGPRRFYRSGDHVKYNSDGSFEFVGRIDAQVKLHGQRLEIEEVEHHMRRALPRSVQPAAAIITPKDRPTRQMLVGFLAFDDGRLSIKGLEADPEGKHQLIELGETIRSTMKKSLPSYMVPTSFLPVDRLPLNRSGKLARDELRRIGSELEMSIILSLSRADPQNAELSPNERTLRDLWSKTLDIDSSLIGTEDGFLQLGGDSLAAMLLTSHARECGFSLSYTDIFRNQQLKNMATVLARDKATATAVRPFELLPLGVQPESLKRNIATQCSIPMDEIEDIYPCTPLQEGLLALTARKQSSYIQRLVYAVPQSIDLARFKDAWGYAVGQYPILRTRIVQDAESGALQVVTKETVAWGSGESLQSYVKEDEATPMGFFDRLLRVAIINDGGRNYLVLTCHHSIYDMTSMQLIWEAVEKTYQGMQTDNGSDFRQFIRHIQQIPDTEYSSFWKAQLHESPGPTFPELLSDYQPSTDTILHRTVQLGNLAEAFPNFTLATIVRAAWALLISQYSGIDDISFGVTLNGRDVPVPDVHRLVAPTFTTVPVRVRFNGKKTLGSLLSQLQDQALQMVPYQHVGLSKIARVSSEAAAVCNLRSLLVVQPATKSWKTSDLGLETIHLPDQDISFYPHPLVMECILHQSEVELHAWIDCKVINYTQGERLLKQFELMLHSFSDGDLLIYDIKSLNPADMDDIFDWNSQEWPARNACVHTGIIEKALNWPHAPAIDAWDGTMTYRKLTVTATNHAHRLRELGVRNGDAIPIFFRKSIWAAVSTLAVLIAGGTCITIDPATPKARLEAMAKQLQPKLVITCPSLEDSLKSYAEATYLVSTDTSCGIESANTSDRVLPEVDPNSPAFIVFTSGSTGIPKGIRLPHHVYLTNTNAFAPIFGLGSQSRVVQFASYNFDISIGDFCLTLLSGGCLCIPSEEQRINQLPQFVRDFRVNHAHMTPSVIGLLDPKEVPTIDRIIAIGEMCPDELVSKWDGKLIITYGPAETTLWCTANPAPSGETGGANIGRGVAASIWIVDQENYNILLPVGVAGELLVSGPLLADGYLDSSQTETSFIENPSWWPLQERGRRRFYKTGDLAKFNSDGTIQILGRKDTQVKIAGQRIELGEIEHHLRRVSDSALSVAVEVVKEGDHISRPTLMAFLGMGNAQSADILTLNGEEVESFLEVTTAAKSNLVDLLPPYSIPAIYVPVGQLPLTTNGKLDRRRLQQLGQSLTEAQIRTFTGSEREARPPTTDNEKILGRLWAEVLKVDASAIGLDDHFFRIGGDSLSAMRLVIAVRSTNQTLTVHDIFRHAKLEDMAKCLTAAEHLSILEDIPPFALVGEEEGAATIREVAAEACKVGTEEIQDVYPVTAAQENMTRASENFQGAYVVHWMYELSSTTELSFFLAAWKHVVERHSIFRTRIFKSANGKLYQAVLQPRFECIREYSDLGSYKHRYGHLSYGDPLNIFGIIDRADGRLTFVWTKHHATYERWSQNLVLDEVCETYLRLQRSESLVSSPPTEYKHFIKHVMASTSSATEFWKAQLQGAKPCDLFAGEPRNTLTIERRISFPRPATSDVTTSTLLTAAWGILTARLSEQEDVTLGVIRTGRSLPIPGIETLIGPTLTRIPVRMKPFLSTPIHQFIQDTQAFYAAAIPHEQISLEHVCQGDDEASRDAARVCKRFPVVLVVHTPDPGTEDRLMKDVGVERCWYDAELGFVRFTVECTPVPGVGAGREDGVDVKVLFSDACAKEEDVQRVLDMLEVVLREFGKDNAEEFGDGGRRIGDIESVV